MSFVGEREHQLQPFGDDQHSLHKPYATSLRMGDLGYQSDAQQALIVCYNNLGSYLQTLCNAITHPHPAYAAIGTLDAAGQYQQLNTSLLQIENEFYSSIRPKRTTQRGETALQALRLRGVEYIEVRCLDLNPFEPLGITASQIHFLDAFLLYCLLQDSPITDDREYLQGQENQKRVVYSGRDPQLQLLRGDGSIPMVEWADEIMGGVESGMELLDQAQGSRVHSVSLAEQRARLAQPALTPSARVLAEMEAGKMSFYQHTLALAERHSQYFAERPLDDTRQAHYQALARDSLVQQAALEAVDQLPFEQHLANYYDQYLCCGCRETAL
jgi:glutamate--cysteine ligase